MYQTHPRATVLKFGRRRGATWQLGGAVVPVICAVLLLTLLCGSASAVAVELRIAVATNFSRTATVLAKQFEQQTGHTVRLAFGSTGKHYAQIKHGAPFDIFFAADERRPALLEKEGIAVPGSRFTYAQGKLVLWSPDKNRVDANGDVLASDNFRKLAIANPKLAPYGFAAREILQARGLWEKLQPRLVRGENIGQTFQFVRTNNAQLGFVAAAQVLSSNKDVDGSYWTPPQLLYTPIIQQAVLVKDTPSAWGFIQFIKSEASRSVIQASGYLTPNPK